MAPEVVSWLLPCLDGTVVDATVGAGGHAGALLAASPRCTVVGIDQDPNAVEIAKRRLSSFGERVRVIRGNFRDLAVIARAQGLRSVGAFLFDLGTSSMQLKDAGRGFSFEEEGPLDMRMDPDAPVSAAGFLEGMPERELARVIRESGEDRHARGIARRIVQNRERGEMRGTADLARAAGPRRGRIHPARRLFQAIRIAVNDELAALREALPAATSLLRDAGRIAVISFHSLEDGIVKRFFMREAKDCICPPEVAQCSCGHRRSLLIHTRKPQRPSEEEAADNPSARSARLRVAERL
jgi:16S rRNA (cytosine1402-N4)-methyltransferase